jgi:hypothetical protein
MSMGTTPLDGLNDEKALSDLYDAIGEPQNPSQEKFVKAWELTGFLASDGFEWLFEQASAPDGLAAILAAVGFTEGAAFVRKAFEKVPATLLAAGQEELLSEHLESQFEPFKALLHEYLGVADVRLVPALGDFVRRNRQHFDSVLP